ncbi:hypothetical protein Q7P37_011028 [Cladosporium fusiforme]
MATVSAFRSSLVVYSVAFSEAACWCICFVKRTIHRHRNSLVRSAARQAAPEPPEVAHDEPPPFNPGMTLEDPFGGALSLAAMSQRMDGTFTSEIFQ